MIRRSAASTASSRASHQRSGGAASQQAGIASWTSCGRKLKKVDTTVGADTAPMAAARDPKYPENPSMPSGA